MVSPQVFNCTPQRQGSSTLHSGSTLTQGGDIGDADRQVRVFTFFFSLHAT